MSATGTRPVHRLLQPLHFPSPAYLTACLVAHILAPLSEGGVGVPRDLRPRRQLPALGLGGRPAHRAVSQGRGSHHRPPRPRRPPPRRPLPPARARPPLAFPDAGT